MRYDLISMLPEHSFRRAGVLTGKLCSLEGGGKGGSAPSAPDPAQTAAAQTSSNKDTASYNAALNRYNTYTPLGNSIWQQNGTDPTTGAPVWQNNISLTPTGQANETQNQANALKLSQTQGQALNAAQKSLGSPLDTSNLPGVQSNVNASMGDAAIQNAINSQYKANMGLLQPQMDQDKTALQAQLANQGLTPGSEAYNNAMNNMARQQSVTTSQAANNATQQGMQYQNQLFGQSLSNAQLQNSANSQLLQQNMALQNQPINLYNSMMTGSQVQMPSFQGTGQITMPGTDTMGATQMGYNGQLNTYNAQMGAANSTQSGLFNLGGSALMAYGMYAL